MNSSRALLVCLTLCVGLNPLQNLRAGEPPPPFWVHWDSTRRTSRKKFAHYFRKQAHAALWLHHKLTDIQPEEVSRAGIRDEAATDHGLSGASFDKLWKSFAREELRKGGRRRGSKNGLSSNPLF